MVAGAWWQGAHRLSEIESDVYVLDVRIPALAALPALAGRDEPGREVEADTGLHTEADAGRGPPTDAVAWLLGRVAEALTGRRTSRGSAGE